MTAVCILSLVSIAAVATGLSITENGTNAWHGVHAWGGLAIAGAVFTLAPVINVPLGLSVRHAWQVAVAGAGILLLFWVLFVLPSAGSNTSLIVTVGTAAGVLAAWFAPGRPADAKQADKPDARPDAAPPGHTW